MPVIRDDRENIRKIEIYFDRAEMLYFINKFWPSLNIDSPGDNIRIYFTVPSGGDWSGQDVEISTETPIKVYIERKEKQTK